MSAAAWAVMGVFVGAALPFLTSIWSERRADKRAEHDRRERHEDRLFDARRAAYEEFQAIARSLMDEAWEHHARLSRNAPPDFNFADDLLRSLGAVRLYASPTTVKAAEALLRAITDYASSDVADAPSVDVLNAAFEYVDGCLEGFSSAARADLRGEP